MTLQQLLDIEKKLVEDDERAGLLLAELIWTKNGEPRNVQRLVLVLETIIKECVRTETRYPRVILKRKKEMERGSWKPCATKPIGITGKSAAERKLAI